MPTDLKGSATFSLSIRCSFPKTYLEGFKAVMMSFCGSRLVTQSFESVLSQLAILGSGLQVGVRENVSTSKRHSKRLEFDLVRLGEPVLGDLVYLFQVLPEPFGSGYL